MVTSRGRLGETPFFIHLPSKERVLIFSCHYLSMYMEYSRTKSSAESLLCACSTGRYKLSHWERNEAIRLNGDGFLMRLFVLDQQVTLVLSKTQGKDGERSREKGKRGETGTESWQLASRLQKRS